MNGTTLDRPDVAAYLDAVRSRLSDLPDEERDDLVADVEASLLESGDPPAISPEEFAAELREAAGLAPEVPAAALTSTVTSLRSLLSSERVVSWRRTARDLAPIWWLARAYVAVVLLALATNQGWPVGSGTSQTQGASFETSMLGLFAATVLSIWLGLRRRREPPRYRRLAQAANIALALMVLPVAVHSFDQLESRSSSEPVVLAEPVPGLAVDGVQVRNVYPYSRDGAPLFDVLLYDEFGAPINVLSGPEDTARRLLADPSGSVVFNSYPIRYFEPGTTTVAQPRLAPAITVPEIVTPPLEQRPR